MELEAGKATFPERPALLTLLTLCCYAIRTAYCTEDLVTKESGEPYKMAELISPHRPIELSRMYTNVLPFGDMLDPVKRSYQFGFPESLRGGTSSEVPVKVAFYTKGTARPTYNRTIYGTAFERFLENHRRVTNKESVPVYFKRLVNSDYNLFTELIDKLGSEVKVTDDDRAKKYLYRDSLREFLLGTWQSWLEDDIFHSEERVYTIRSNVCRSQTDVLCLWRRFLLVILSTKINIKGATLDMPDVQGGEIYSSLDTAALAFWYAYCQILIEKGITDKTAMGHCPDPCRNNPCTDMAYTMTDNCETHKGGIFEKDFKCTCMEVAHWSYRKGACVLYDRCKMNNPCSLTGTEKCNFNVMTKEVKCQCKPGFMGHDCSQARDACFVRQVTNLGSLPAGNRACNVEAGNECLPMLGSDLFSCRCRRGWLVDATWGRALLRQSGPNAAHEVGIPNCQQRHDQCMSLPCEAGDCVSSSQMAMCQCPITHTGDNCQRRRGYWAAWGPWSSCDPDCGDRRVRHRSRACLGLECLGQHFETVWCAGGTVDCGVPERLGQYPADRWRTSIVLRHTLMALAIGVGMSMGVIFACQCCITIVLKCDRGLLNCAVQERAHFAQIMAYRRLCCKAELRLH